MMFELSTSPPLIPSGLPGKPITRHSSCSVALPWELNEERTSQRSTASSVYRLKYGRADSPGAATPWTIARYQVGDAIDERRDQCLLGALVRRQRTRIDLLAAMLRACRTLEGWEIDRIYFIGRPVPE
jgi:hypothetical protein